MNRRGVRAVGLPPRGELVVGRSPTCAIFVEDEKASREHGILRVEGDRVEYVDRGGKNGSHVGGRKLEPRECVTLEVGDVITVGSTVLRFQHALPSPVPLASASEFAARLETERASRAAFALIVLRIDRLQRATVADATTATTREILLASEIEATFSEALRKGDLVSSAKGAAYHLLLPETDEAEANRVSAAVSLRLDRRGVGAELGLALFPRDGETLDELVAAAGRRVVVRARGRDARAPRATAPSAMSQLEPLVAQVAKSAISVLIVGETGVGKEVLASSIHARSPRASAPFLAINCAALSESLFESELFGHEKGAFTGADRAKVGLLEAAAGGTIFLDEVGEMPLGLQAKLLRVLERREVLRVGSVRASSIDVRVLSATNRNLESEIAARRFRQDLYFRLNAMTIEVPPLRKRVDEIEPLALRFLREACELSAIAAVPKLATDALDALKRHDWPGNVRELRNTIERALIFSQGEGVIRRGHLQLGRLGPPEVIAASSLTAEEQAERAQIVDAIERCIGNQTYAAELLGISRRTLVSRLRKYGIARPRTRPPELA